MTITKEQLGAVVQTSYFIAKEARTPEQLRTWHREALLLEAESAPAGPPVACTAGCSHCCYQAVSARPFEVVLAHAAVTDWAAVHASAARVLEQDNLTRQRLRIPCAFLHEGRCSVYAVRPGACRAEHSFDPKACELPAGSHPLNTTQLVLPKAVITGAEVAFEERDLDIKAVEFVLALDAIRDVKDPIERWLAGERLFPPSVQITYTKKGGLVQLRLGDRRMT